MCINSIVEWVSCPGHAAVLIEQLNTTGAEVLFEKDERVKIAPEGRAGILPVISVCEYQSWLGQLSRASCCSD